MRFLYQLIELIKPRLLIVNFTVKTAVIALIAAITSAVIAPITILLTIQVTTVKYKINLITNC